MYMLQSYWIAGTCGVGGGAVAGEVVGELQLRQLDARVHVQRHDRVPLEHQVVRRVWYCTGIQVSNTGHVPLELSMKFRKVLPTQVGLNNPPQLSTSDTVLLSSFRPNIVTWNECINKYCCIVTLAVMGSRIINV